MTGPPRDGFAAGEEEWRRRLGTLRQVVRQELVARQLAAHVPDRPSRRVLDIGCGQGTQALLLARRGHTVTGLDSSARMLADFRAALSAEPAEVAERVRNFIVNRAPDAAVAGGKEALRLLIDDIIEDWKDTAEEQVAGGNAFAYSRRKSPHRLLHQPLEPEIDNLAAGHARFVAGRSMRDVEPGVRMNVKDPSGFQIANADDV